MIEKGENDENVEEATSTEEKVENTKENNDNKPEPKPESAEENDAPEEKVIILIKYNFF